MFNVKSKRAWGVLLTLIILAVYSSANLSMIKAETPDNRPVFTMSQLRLNGRSDTTTVKQGDILDMYMLVKLTSPSTPPVEDVAGTFTFYLCDSWDQNNASNRHVIATYDAVEPREWSTLSDTEQSLYYSNGIVNKNVVAIQYATLDTSPYAPGTTLYLTVEYKAANSSEYASKHSRYNRKIIITSPDAPESDPPSVSPVTSPITYGENAFVDVTAHSSTATSGTLNFYVEDTLVATKTVTVGDTERIEINGATYLNKAGTYNVKASFIPDGSTTPVEATETFDVVPRPITLTASDVALSLNDPFPASYAWQVTAGDLVFGDVLTGIVVTPNIADTSTPQTGLLRISQQDDTALPNSNYAITFVSGHIIVDRGGNENTPPNITNITHNPIITQQNIPVQFNVDDQETPRKDLIVDVYEGTDKDPAKKISSTNNNGACRFVATQNGVYTLVVTDAEGKSAETTVTIDTIDKIPPTLNPVPDNTESTRDPVTVTINAEDTADEGAAFDTPGIQTIVVTDDSNNPVVVTDGKFTVDNNGTYTITVTDKAGNSKTTTIEITNITDEPASEAPSEEEPSTETPSEEESSTEAPDEEDEDSDEEEPSTEAPSKEEPSTEAPVEPTTEAPDEKTEEPETTTSSVLNDSDKTSPDTGDTTPVLFLTLILFAAILTLNCTIVNIVTNKKLK